MASEYKSWYLKDLIPIIEHTALDIMTDPIASGRKRDGSAMTIAEISNQNSMIAMRNAGVREMMSTLIVILAKDGEDDG